jgi:hypothetical protein
MYDLIGDIHGHAEVLKLLLYKMDYREVDGVWQHPQRSAIFVGDYIDRGPAIRETLSIVHRMVEGSKAIALMGNHEYNALAYAKEDGRGGHLRTHNEVHTKQHEATLQQFVGYEREWQHYFYTLPLFLELPVLRAVHACWDSEGIEWLRQKGYRTMSEELLVASHQKGTTAYRVINDILKGVEYNIPEQYVWRDKDGHPRTSNRIKWWVTPEQTRYSEVLFNCPLPLQDLTIAADMPFVVYPATERPVFFGHYWLEDRYPVVQAHNVVCLDYSIAKGGNLVAYRWNGEQEIDARHFVHVHYTERMQ